MASIAARAGDVQALKACIAAAASDTSIQLTAAAGAGTPTSLFGTPSICLLTPEGLPLTEPNAVALYLSGDYGLLDMLRRVYIHIDFMQQQ
jgi:hypothetical protein